VSLALSLVIELAGSLLSAQSSSVERHSFGNRIGKLTASFNTAATREAPVGCYIPYVACVSRSSPVSGSKVQRRIAHLLKAQIANGVDCVQLRPGERQSRAYREENPPA
jgi:hypothetical protein